VSHGAFMSRADYAARYGPTAGDRIRLGDTNLWIEVERDNTVYGDELLGGQGKTDREWVLSSSTNSRDEAMDVIITNVVVMDPVLGVFKANIGIKDGRIAGLGPAGSPNVIAGAPLRLDALTGIVPAEGLLATPGGIDTHVHFIQPALIPEALSAGITTLIGMGCGFFDMGTNPLDVLHKTVVAMERLPVNIGFLARCSSTVPGPVAHMIEAGACGLKIHEDKGAYPAIVDTALTVADRMDVQVCIHTDGLNETACLEDTLAAIGDRTIHAYHVDGAGGGHVPNILAIVGQGRVLCSSTTPTIPFGIHAVAEHLDMIRTVHRMKPGVSGDDEMARRRIRATTMAAENVLHDMGAIPIMTSDSQGMGRIGETIRRTWQLAHRMKAWESEAGSRPFWARSGAGAGRADNARVLRYLAKYTINPAIAHGLAHEVGSLEVGKLADVVLWQPRFFGVRPDMVFKAGYPVWGNLPEGNASTRVCQPSVYRPHWGSLGDAPAAVGVLFVSQASLHSALGRSLPTRRRRVAVKGTRGIGPEDMVRHGARPRVEIDPATTAVSIDGHPVELPPAVEVPLNRLYLLT